MQFKPNPIRRHYRVAFVAIAFMAATLFVALALPTVAGAATPREANRQVVACLKRAGGHTTPTPQTVRFARPQYVGWGWVTRSGRVTGATVAGYVKRATLRRAVNRCFAPYHARLS